MITISSALQSSAAATRKCCCWATPWVRAALLRIAGHAVLAALSTQMKCYDYHNV